MTDEQLAKFDSNPPTMIRSDEHHALAIEHNGLVFVKTPAAWHELGKALEAARAEVERLTRIVAGGNEALRRARKASEDETRRLGYEPGALQMRWRGWGSPPPKSDTPNYWQELYGAICDALTQEGIVAWPGDGTGIVTQMIDAQVKAREKAEAENARLREALDIARKHLLNSDGFYFGPLNKTVIRSGTTQGGIERTQDGYPIGGITIHNYGQAVVQEMDAALAANETPTA